MFRWFARRALAAWGSSMEYDVSYIQFMLEASPAAFRKFSAIAAPSTFRGAAPVDAYFAAKIIAARSEDCGPCTQICVFMARRARMSDAQIEAVLTDAAPAMNTATLLGYRFALAVLRGDCEEEREALQTAFGDEALVALSMGIALARVYPITKRGLGFAKSCQKIRLNGRDLTVVKAA